MSGQIWVASYFEITFSNMDCAHSLCVPQGEAGQSISNQQTTHKDTVWDWLLWISPGTLREATILLGPGYQSFGWMMGIFWLVKYQEIRPLASVWLDPWSHFHDVSTSEALFSAMLIRNYLKLLSMQWVLTGISPRGCRGQAMQETVMDVGCSD